MSAPAPTTSPIVQVVGGTFNPDTHQYWDAKGIEVPSVTQVMESVGLVSLDNIPGETLERKRRLGDAVHFATHSLDICNTCQGILNAADYCKRCNKKCEEGSLEWDTVHKDCVPFIWAYQQFKKETGFIVEGVEEGGIHELNGMPYAYTWDNIGRFPGIKYRTILEKKCTYRQEIAWKWQTAPYAKSVKRTDPNEHIVRVAVQLKPDGSFQMSPFYEDPRDIDVFGWALALTWVKINNGLKWKKEKV